MKTEKHLYIQLRWILGFLCVSAISWAAVIVLVATYLNNDTILVLITLCAICFLILGILFGIEIARSQPLPQQKQEDRENQPWL